MVTGIMVSKGNHPQMVLFSEIFYIYIYYNLPPFNPGIFGGGGGKARNF